MEQLIHRIALRVTPEDYERLHHTAKANNLTVSKYVRLLIRNALHGENK